MLVKHLVKSVFDACEELGVDFTGCEIDIFENNIGLKHGNIPYSYSHCYNYKDVYNTVKMFKDNFKPSKCGKCKTCKCVNKRG